MTLLKMFGLAQFLELCCWIGTVTICLGAGEQPPQNVTMTKMGNAPSSKNIPGSRELLHLLGQDYADPYVTNADILHACHRLRELLDQNAPVEEVDYLAFQPSGNLGFGEHAALKVVFAPNGGREPIVFDIGRRPSDSQSSELSVVRVYENGPYLHYVLNVRRARDIHFNRQRRTPLRTISISTLCPSWAARALAKNVLHDLSQYIDKPEHDPMAWNFNLAFNNCARYVQTRVGTVAEPASIRQFVLNYAPHSLIAPAAFGDYLAQCDLYAQALDARTATPSNLFAVHPPLNSLVTEAQRISGRPLSDSEAAKTRAYFRSLSAAEKEQWATFLNGEPRLSNEALIFNRVLKSP